MDSNWCDGETFLEDPEQFLVEDELLWGLEDVVELPQVERNRHVLFQKVHQLYLQSGVSIPEHIGEDECFVDLDELRLWEWFPDGALVTFRDQNSELIDGGLNRKPFFDSWCKAHKEILYKLPLFFFIITTKRAINNHFLNILLILNIKFWEHLKGQGDIIMKPIKLVTFPIL